MKRATMKDVAKLAGVSGATVSYVVNNGPRPVSDETRSRVLSAIETLHYHPHALARSLKKGSSQTIGFLVQSLISPFVSNLVNSIEENLANRGYGLILASAHENPERELQMLNTLASQAIDGLLYIPTSYENGDVVKHLIEEGLPVVFVDREIKGIPADIVMTDNLGAAKLATDYMIQKGCRRILCITFSEEASSAMDRMEGYRQALKENGIPLDEKLIYLFPYASGESLEKSLLAQIKEFGLPDGIICMTDTMLIDATETLKKLGIRVPEQVQVGGGFFNSPWNRLLDPPMPVVSQNYALIARYAVEFLLDRINGNKELPRVKLVDVDFFHG
jgi:DNA-binding LacI/PurR family transcriptional regulator